MTSRAAPSASRVGLERLSAQLLAGSPATRAVDVVERILAVQAQDPRGARLAVRARSTGLHVSDVDEQLGDGTLLISWLNRGTLHLVTRADYWWLHELTTPQLLTGVLRRLRQEGVTEKAADTGVQVIARCLADDGPLTRAELRARVDAAGVRTQGQALVHTLALATLRGLIVRGPMKGTEQAFVLVHDWLGARPAVDRDVALAELARRFLTGHGPADDRDLARWAGIPLGEARRGLAAIAGELAERTDGLADVRRRRRALAVPPPKLLGSFEPVLMGWTSRAWVLDEGQRLVTINGVFKPFLLVEGRAAGTWTMPRGEVMVEPFERLGSEVGAAVAAEAADVVRFLGG